MLNSIHATTNARIVLAASPFVVEGDGAEIRGKRVLAIEDGPTLTHGEMTYGAAVLAAKRTAPPLVDLARSPSARSPRRSRTTRMGELLPAMGYGDEQVEELRETIARSDADLVLIGTPIDLRRLIDFDSRRCG